jgi:alkanesulfonate monooxygenase SsuD/methylene tetrahydromethanopterin reductase-like flavin-dependent oxidoreductase (luciferase family)
VTDDVRSAHDSMRSELVTNFGLPFYRAMLERSGYGEEIAAYDAAAGTGERMRAAISDEFFARLTAVGDETSVRAGIQRYTEAGVTLPAIGPIAGTDFEATLRASAPETPV